MNNLLHNISGVRYTDQRLTDAQFTGVKNKLPYGQLPIAKVDGEFIAQSTAIARYDTGSQFGMCGEQRLENLEPDDNNHNHENIVIIKP